MFVTNDRSNALMLKGKILRKKEKIIEIAVSNRPL